MLCDPKRPPSDEDLPKRMSTPQQPTKQERREAAREARRQAEEQEAAAAQRKKRLAIILGAVAVAAVIAIVLIATTSGGNDAANNTAKGNVSGKADVAAELAGVPQSGIVLGDPKAKVTVVEFLDPQCPICKRFSNEVFPTIVQDYIRPGKIRYEMRTLDFIGPDSVRGAQFINAAGLQDKQFNASELIYRNQGQENSGYMTDAFLQNIGDAIPGFNTSKAMTDMSSPQVKAVMGAANTMASRYGVTGTPTLLVGKTGGTLAEIKAPSLALSEYQAGINAALQLNG